MTVKPISDYSVRYLIPAIGEQKLARFCDVFVEEGAFSIAEARNILNTAKASGLGLKVHADQLSNGGGAQLAAELWVPYRLSTSNMPTQMELKHWLRPGRSLSVCRWLRFTWVNAIYRPGKCWMPVSGSR